MRTTKSDMERLFQNVKDTADRAGVDVSEWVLHNNHPTLMICRKHPDHGGLTPLVELGTTTREAWVALGAIQSVWRMQIATMI